MAGLVLVLWIFAVVLFILAAFNVAAPRVNLGWAGAACAAVAVLIGHVPL